MPNNQAFAVINCYGNECCRFMYREMAASVAERYCSADPVMRAWGPYTVAEIARDAEIIVADKGARV